MRLPRVSLPALIAFAICAAAVTIAFLNTRDYSLLRIALPMLLALLLIPMILSVLNRQVSSDIKELHADKLRLAKIQNINVSQVGEPVKITGTVEKISFQWLNRPLLSVRDNTGTIPVIMFTPLPGEIVVGDRVQVVGMIMRKLLLRGKPAISAISVGKLSG
jgi:hypothetical protein